MAVELNSFKVDDDGEIRIRHTVYANTETEAYALLAAHAEICPKFGPAYKNDKTLEIVRETDSLPTVDTLDEFVDGEPDEEDEEDGD